MRHARSDLRRIVVAAFVLCFGFVAQGVLAQGPLGFNDGTLPFKLRGTVIEA